MLLNSRDQKTPWEACRWMLVWPSQMWVMFSEPSFSHSYCIRSSKTCRGSTTLLGHVLRLKFDLRRDLLTLKSRWRLSGASACFWFPALYHVSSHPSLSGGRKQIADSRTFRSLIGSLSYWWCSREMVEVQGHRISVAQVNRAQWCPNIQAIYSSTHRWPLRRSKFYFCRQRR